MRTADCELLVSIETLSPSHWCRISIKQLLVITIMQVVIYSINPSHIVVIYTSSVEINNVPLTPIPLKPAEVFHETLCHLP
jgi:hypothetical protein